MSDPYVVLGLPRDASSSQVAETYRALAQIYHPDRYVDAPARVRDEATRRMQDLNAAFAELQKRHASRARPRATTHDRPPPARAPGAARTAQPTPPPRTPPRQAPPPPATTVLYVDGTGRYHSASVAPLGFGIEDEETKRVADAAQCGRLNAELLEWFRLQRASATMVDKLMFEAWSRDQQAMYTATMGCARVPLAKVRGFGIPCAECNPRVTP